MTISRKVWEEVLQLVAEGNSVSKISEMPGMPGRNTIHTKIQSDPQFRDNYARACNIRADVIFDEIFEIADDGRNDWMEQVNSEGEVVGYRENGEALRRSALRVDARKWALARMNPRKYGDKTVISGDEDSPLKITLIERRIVQAGD